MWPVNSVKEDGADLLAKLEERPKPTWPQPSLFDDEAGELSARQPAACVPEQPHSIRRLPPAPKKAYAVLTILPTGASGEALHAAANRSC
jgi:hypothetical protein